jgi:multiple sugar transport system ATP-binding protein
VERAEISRRVVDVAGVLGLGELLERKPHALSGGQRQRVALGRAIVRDPKVFLFDEPLSNLDAALRVSTRGEISAIHRRLGATMIYVTHDQVEAMTMGTRICIMNGGRVVQVGPPLEVYRKPATTFVASFLGNPPMNLLPAVVTDRPGGRVLKIGNEFIDLPTAVCQQLTVGRDVTFGVRPEHISLAPSSDSAESYPLDVQVKRIEALGAETIIAAEIPGAPSALYSRFAGDTDLKIGEKCKLHLNLASIRLFAQDGNALLQPRAGQ